jgi:RNA polymerase sigma-70 factor (ECF subfamily)
MHETMADSADIQATFLEAQAGSREAFDALARRLGSRIEGLVLSRLGKDLRRRVDPEDVKQEALLRAFQDIGRFSWEGEESFLHWIGAIVENVILKAHERLRYRRAMPLDQDPFTDQVSPSKALRREERFERLRAALERLSPDHREVIVLARIEKLPGREIAKRMGRSEQAVAQLLSRALRNLREGFGDTASFTLPDRSLGKEGGSDGER